MHEIAPPRKASQAASRRIHTPGPLLLVVLLLTGLCSITGCSSGPASLTFKSTHSEDEYSQQFSRAFYSHPENGEYHAVLIEDGIHPNATKPSEPIVASAAAPLSQTVHVRVLWRPIRGTKPDAPSATNSIIDWYVRTNDSASATDHLHYRGAGFVSVSESKGQARFVIRSAHLELADSGGKLRDPLGASSLSGEFVALKNPGVVTSTVDDLMASAERPALPSHAAHDGPPPRTPAGP